MRTFWRTAKHYWQIHLIVALCTAVATGVLAGALIVGDSMRDSLRTSRWTASVQFSTRLLLTIFLNQSY